MTKDLKDYLHLYLGCDVKHQSFVKPFVLKQISDTSVRIGSKDGDDSYNTLLENVKPILRRLSSMTEEEVKEFIGWEKLNEMYVDVTFSKNKSGIDIGYGISTGEFVSRHWHKISFTEWSPKEWLWLLKKGFDLFNLIDEKLAIDAATLETVNAK